MQRCINFMLKNKSWVTWCHSKASPVWDQSVISFSIITSKKKKHWLRFVLEKMIHFHWSVKEPSIWQYEIPVNLCLCQALDFMYKSSSYQSEGTIRSMMIKIVMSRFWTTFRGDRHSVRLWFICLVLVANVKPAHLMN